MKKFILLVFMTTAYHGLSFAQSFKINGTCEGLADGTWLYLKEANTNRTLDSTQLLKGNFALKGKMSEEPAKVLLHTDKFSNYVFFWLESTPLSMHLKAGEFKKGSIKGSKTQDEDHKLMSIIQPIKDEQESLTASLKKTTDSNAQKVLKNRLKQTNDSEKQAYMNYVKNNPGSLIAANILNIYASTWGKKVTESLYAAFTPQIKQSRFGKDIKTFISLNREIKIGSKFVDFEQSNAAGKNIKLSDIKGKYILLEFWASWCGPCREENPTLVNTFKEFQDKGFNILGVSADNDKNNWLNAIKHDGLLWENVSDLQGDKNHAALMYGISAYPTNFLINDKGIIIAKNLRGDQLRKKLLELLP
ncbi:TlpA disulfide reductase family protein [Pedobacter montanisoli]|uniref:AhpC/TSA family protein n=1 Tax=Pedobacter montanisoli TaxID=2923277 RepID=A0ABS9ZWJ7_9SPHI|nr:TlpA disulfide reductase family protein [Pedobacter montanisoli]MCJ0742669.1 AhpC/TSA family protein [Pedobacter montanisoli]